LGFCNGNNRGGKSKEKLKTQMKVTPEPTKGGLESSKIPKGAKKREAITAHGGDEGSESALRRGRREEKRR